MSVEQVLAAVAANRSLWVELECPNVARDLRESLVNPVADPVHCTLTFHGKGCDPYVVTSLVGSIHRMAADRLLPFTSRVSGVARFRGNEREGDPVVLLLSDPRIRTLRQDIVDRMKMPASDWDYTPHVTLGRVPRDWPIAIQRVTFDAVLFESIAVCAGEDRISFRMGDR